MAKMIKNNKHIVITVEELPKRNYISLLSSLNESLLIAYSYVFSKAYSCSQSNITRLPQRPSNLIDDLNELQQLGLVSIEESR